jgi:hypothetical protein
MAFHGQATSLVVAKCRPTPEHFTRMNITSPILRKSLRRIP